MRRWWAVVMHKCVNCWGFPPQSGKSVEEVERAVLEEFGRCMRQIISSAQSGVCSLVCRV
jgi:hypothetical protein